MQPAKSAPEPRIAKRRIHVEGAIKPRHGFTRLVLCGQQKSFERERLGIARRERETFVQGNERLVDMAKTEFQFRHARPGEAKIR